MVVGVKDMCDALREIGPSAMREVAIPKVYCEPFSVRTLYLWYGAGSSKQETHLTHTHTHTHTHTQ